MDNKITPPENTIKIELNNDTTLMMWQKNSAIYIYAYDGTGNDIDFENVIASNIVSEGLLCENILENLM